MKGKVQCAFVAVMLMCTVQALGLSEDGLVDALRRVAAVKLNKLSNLVRLYLPDIPLLLWFYVICILRLPHVSSEALVCRMRHFGACCVIGSCHMHNKGPAAAPSKVSLPQYPWSVPSRMP